MNKDDAKMKMLSPIRLGPVEVKNRVVSTAHASFVDFFQKGCDGEQYIAYQERRAEGGTGLLIITAMHVHKSTMCTNHFNYDPIDIAPKLRKLADRVHKHGAKILSQLFHQGSMGKTDCRPELHPLWSMSGHPSASGEASHEMTEDEIEQVIQGFVDTAKIVVENGIDGVELHGTHGYLLQQSFTPWSNTRKDKWGEQFYFAKTLAKRVRDAIGPKAVMGLRLSADDFWPPEQGGLGPEGIRRVAATLIQTGLFDYLNHSEGSGNEHYARAIGSFRHRFGQYLPLTRGLKEAIGGAVPVIGTGKIPTPDLAEQALRDGDCDLVGMTRAQIADPDLVRKLETGQANRIRTCTGSNQGCIDRIVAYPVTCIQNPEIGYEYKLTIDQVADPKKVLVIGGGPAGMKAAELAARRGHQVTLVEASDRLGGRLNYTANDVNASNLLSAIAWVEQELQILKVKIMTQTRVDEAFIQNFKPQAVILATGASPSADLKIANDDSIPVINTDDAAAGVFNGQKFDMAGTRCLFVDLRANYETTLVTEMLIKRGSQVTVATPYLHFGANIGFTHMDDLMKSLPKQGMETLANTVITAIHDGKVSLRHVYSGKTTSGEYDFVVAGAHPRVNNELHNFLAKYCPVTLVGDVVAPRSVLEAFREGDRAGRVV